MSAGVSLIEVVDLSHDFGEGPVLNNLTFCVGPAECIALAGPNGSGKTTLLRCLAGSLVPRSGALSWFGERSRTSSWVRRQIGFVSHRPQLYPQLSVRENLLFAARMTDVPAPARRVRTLLEASGFGPLADVHPPRLSKGMAQKAAVLRGVVHDPRILLMDEPYAGLDPEACEWLDSVLQAVLRKGGAVCFSSHDARVNQRLPRRVLRFEATSQQCVGLVDAPSSRTMVA